MYSLVTLPGDGILPSPKDQGLAQTDVASGLFGAEVNNC
jgi:hypothetical protein